ncbi:MAG: transcription antitermination factor NusB [Thermodesulfobacteriota bacterium]
MGRRRRARELAMQVLFHLEYSPGDPEEALERVCGNFDIPPRSRGFARRLVMGVFENREVLDRMIRDASRNWRLERMSKVDRNILRIGAFEVVFLRDIPAKASIDEAVELGKIYGAGDSGSFINGVLDNIFNSVQLQES